MSKTQISNERRDKNKEKKRRKRFFIYFFGSILALVFILGLTISPALGSGNSSNKIKGKPVGWWIIISVFIYMSCNREKVYVTWKAI